MTHDKNTGSQHEIAEDWYPPPLISIEQLTNEQRVTATRATRGESLFITGPAGTGKSFLVRFIIQELERLHPKRIAVTASTGIAAANIGGQTLHSFAGIGNGLDARSVLIARVKRNVRICQRWRETQVLVIDEISMLSENVFELIAAIAQATRQSRVPFGGLQLILTGDFLQLPPVSTREKQRAKYCFESKAWNHGGFDSGTVVLQEVVRQSSDQHFVSILNEVRNGIVSPSAKVTLDSCNISVKALPQDGIVPTKLYCLNRNVDTENMTRLAALPGQPVVFQASDCCRDVLDAQTKKALFAILDQAIPSELALKKGAQVIMMKNKAELELVNGSRGIVVGFEHRLPLVRFETGLVICVGKARFVQGIFPAKVARIQVPSKLGWALTVHKAQGMTLTRAELQVDNAFEVGQAYVALSRLTSTTGLWIRGSGLSTANTLVDPIVLDFYRRVATTAVDDIAASPRGRKRLLSIGQTPSNQKRIRLSEQKRTQITLPNLFSSMACASTSSSTWVQPLEASADEVIVID